MTLRQAQGSTATVTVIAGFGTKQVVVENVTEHFVDEHGTLTLEVVGGRVYFAADRWTQCWVGTAQPGEEKEAEYG